MQSQQKLLLTFQTAPRGMEYWGIQLCVEVYPRHNFEFTWLLVGYIWGYITHNSSIRSEEGLTPKALDLNSSSYGSQLTLSTQSNDNKDFKNILILERF